MKMTKLPLYKLKSQKHFKDLLNLTTTQLLQELSFFDKDNMGNIVKLSLQTSVEQRIKTYLIEKLNEFDIPIVDFPTIQNIQLWEISNRDKIFKEDFVFTNDGKILYPTSEEPTIGYLSKNSNISYQHLPLLIAGFRKLFRNCTSKNLIRLNEFDILDIYSIDKDFKSIEETIETVIRPLFDSVQKKLKLDLTPVDKRKGYVDFKQITEEGDDKIPEDKRKCVSVGVIMNLGKTYSNDFELKFTDQDGTKKYPYVGSYAFGIERLFYSIIHEKIRIIDDKISISWPEGFAPFDVGIIGIDNGSFEQKIYKEFSTENIRTIYEDTNDNIGLKIRRLYAIGIPYLIFAGKREREGGIIGIEETATGNHYELKQDEFLKNIKGL